MHVGDRIVAIIPRDGEDSAWRGVVKWKGFLTNIDRTLQEELLGVQLDEPHGGGTGKFKGRKIFEASRDHAVFVAVESTVLEREFDEQERLKSDTVLIDIGDTKKQHLSPPSTPAPRNLRKGSVAYQSFSSVDDVQRASNSALIVKPDSVGEATAFQIGSCVQYVTSSGQLLYGVVRYVGASTRHDGDRTVGIELETPHHTSLSDGHDKEGTRHFNTLAPNSALFMMRSEVAPDARFSTPVLLPHERFGRFDSGVVHDYVEPPVVEDVKEVCGLRKGIQGHSNSCYLDSSLYALFAHSDICDALLCRPARRTDMDGYKEIRDSLAHNIIYPLRKYNYVRADKVVEFRQLLHKHLPDVPEVIDMEMDPEEFFAILFDRVLKPSPFIRLRDGEGKTADMNICQLLFDGTIHLGGGDGDSSLLPNVQLLLERYFTDQRLTFDRQPRVLIVQLPRSGSHRCFEHIFPNHVIDTTHLVHNNIRPCVNTPSCRAPATRFCRECYMTRVKYMDEATFCEPCFVTAHASKETADHTFETVRGGGASARGQRQSMRLISVLCIHSSHYVTFANTNSSHNCNDGSLVGLGAQLSVHGDHEWVMHDSMADRCGGEGTNGYCMPQVTVCADMKLTREHEADVLAAIASESTDQLGDNIKRLINDAYFCVYADDSSAALFVNHYGHAK